MKRRLIAAIVCISMVLCSLSITAFAEFSYTKSPGISEYYQVIDSAAETSIAAFDGEYMNITPGGSAKYEFTLPFDAKTIDLKYKVPENATLTLTFPTNQYNVDLKVGQDTATIELKPEHSGEVFVTLSSDKRVLVKEMKYTKVDNSCKGENPADVFGKVVKYTPYQEAVQSSIILMEGSSAIKVRNLVRYINMDNSDETVTMIDGSMHLPVSTLARAFSLYYEDYPEKKYVYISGDDMSIYFTEGESYFEKAGNKSAIENCVKYLNGKAYLPVRKISEILGYTVLYKDGITVIDTKLAAEAVVANRSVMNLITRELKAYIPAEKEGIVYHVDCGRINAADTNPGTEDFPFATIQKAADVAIAGDTVIIHEGTYRESVKVRNSGQAGNPIIFKSADGEKVTISAFDEVSHFAPYTNEVNGVKMYMASLGDLNFDCLLDGGWDIDRNFVLYNGDVLTEGRHPNSKTSTEKTEIRFNGLLEKTEENPDQLEEFTFAKVPDFNSAYPDLANHKMLPTQGDMRIRDSIKKGTPGIVYNHPIRSDIDLNQDIVDYWKGSTFVTFTGKGWQPAAIQVTSSKKGEAIGSEFWNAEVGTVTYYQDKFANDYGYLTHHINTVDMPGEWYINNKEKFMYVIPPKGANPATMSFEVKARQNVFNMAGKNYVQLQNINTRGGGITMADSTGCVLNGGTHKYISQFDISGMYCMEDLDALYNRKDPLTGVYVYPAGKNITNTDMSGEAGFAVSGLYNAVVNTDIEYSSGAGIYLTGSYSYLENNKVDKTGYGATYVGGIYLRGTHAPKGYPNGGHQIYQNTSTAAGRACFGAGTMTASAPMDVAFNEFAYGMMMGRDGGTFYTVHMIGGTDLHDTDFHHNSIHDILGYKEDSLLTCTVYNDGETGMYDIYDNILYFSDDNPSYLGRHLFSQGGTKEVELDKWSNAMITFDSADQVKLNADDYPGAYPIQTGARDDADRSFTLNIDKDRYNYVSNLANGELENGAYVDGDGYVIFPTQNDSAKVSDIKIGNSGSRIYFYYASDVYNQDIANISKAKVEFIKDGKSIGTQSVELFAHAPEMDFISTNAMYVPSQFAGCDTIKVSSNSSGIRFANVAISDFNFDSENAKRDIKFDAQIIPAGSYDRIDRPSNDTSRVLEPKIDLSETAAENLSYWAVPESRQNGFLYKGRTIQKACDKIMITAATNYKFGFTKASIYIGNDTSGELVGEVDFSEKRSKHDAWGRSNFEGKMFKTIQPGTYDLYVKFNNTSDELGEFGMSTTFEAIALY